MSYWQKLDNKNKTGHNLVVGLSLYLENPEDRKTFYGFEKSEYLFNT